FDKTAKMLGLPYPGGPLIDKYAQSGDVLKFPFSEPKIPELNFSFSGFKTQVLYFLQKQEKLNPEFVKENMADICASIQYNLIKILMSKLKMASKQFGINEIAIAGGVAANSELRKQLKSTAQQLDWKVYIPDFQYCTDNAGMIAITAYYKFLKKQFCAINIPIQPRLNF
ncbi:MAG TPA: carbamoyltransferase N-terminal domain-containing protein, partial [Chitinophagales bacterium]|nr:carbamoyltransferase N-terminal domain-containing protein [Chitinophagales bacterium]